MSAAVAAIVDIKDKLSPDIQKASAGWVGSKACSRGHFVTKDSNGFLDQARAAGGAVTSTVDIGIAMNDIASTVAAAADEALDFQYRSPGEHTEIGLPVVTNSDTYITPTAAMEGDAVGLYRCTDGSYAWDTNASGHGKIKRVDISRGLVYVIVFEANRLM